MDQEAKIHALITEAIRENSVEGWTILRDVLSKIPAGYFSEGISIDMRETVQRAHNLLSKNQATRHLNLSSILQRLFPEVGPASSSNGLPPIRRSSPSFGQQRVSSNISHVGRAPSPSNQMSSYPQKGLRETRQPQVPFSRMPMVPPPAAGASKPKILSPLQIANSKPGTAMSDRMKATSSPSALVESVTPSSPSSSASSHPATSSTISRSFHQSSSPSSGGGFNLSKLDNSVPQPSVPKRLGSAGSMGIAFGGRVTVPSRPGVGADGRTQSTGAGAPSTCVKSEEIKSLISFDETQLDPYALPVKAGMIKGSAGGKWQKSHPEGLMHFSQTRHQQRSGMTILVDDDEDEENEGGEFGVGGIIEGEVVEGGSPSALGLDGTVGRAGLQPIVEFDQGGENYESNNVSGRTVSRGFEGGTLNERGRSAAQRKRLTLPSHLNVRPSGSRQSVVRPGVFTPSRPSMTAASSQRTHRSLSPSYTSATSQPAAAAAQGVKQSGASRLHLEPFTTTGLAERTIASLPSFPPPVTVPPSTASSSHRRIRSYNSTGGMSSFSPNSARSIGTPSSTMNRPLQSASSEASQTMNRSNYDSKRGNGTAVSVRGMPKDQFSQSSQPQYSRINTAAAAGRTATAGSSFAVSSVAASLAPRTASVHLQPTPDAQAASTLRTVQDVLTYFAGSGKADPLKFVYMNINKRGKSRDEDINPYDLIVVPREEVDPEYYIFSVSGVVHVMPSRKVRMQVAQQEEQRRQREEAMAAASATVAAGGVLGTVRDKSATTRDATVRPGTVRVAPNGVIIRAPVSVGANGEKTTSSKSEKGSSTDSLNTDDGETCEAMTISRFVQESTFYSAIRKLTFFRNFRLVKSFFTWRREVRYQIYCNHRATIESQLFFAHNCFCSALMSLGALYRKVVDTPPFKLDIERKQAFDPAEFISYQGQCRAATKEATTAASAGMAQTVAHLVTDILQRAYAPDQGQMTEDDMADAALAGIIRSQALAKSMAAEKREKIAKQQAIRLAKQQEQMLGRFIGLLDYLCVEMMFRTMIQSGKLMLSVCQAFQKSKGSVFVITFQFVEKERDPDEEDEEEEDDEDMYDGELELDPFDIENDEDDEDGDEDSNESGSADEGDDGDEGDEGNEDNEDDEDSEGSVQEAMSYFNNKTAPMNSNEDDEGLSSGDATRRTASSDRETNGDDTDDRQGDSDAARGNDTSSDPRERRLSVTSLNSLSSRRDQRKKKRGKDKGKKGKGGKGRKGKRGRKGTAAGLGANSSASASSSSSSLANATTHQIKLTRCEMKLSPTKEEVLELIDTTIDEAINLMCSVDRPLHITPHRPLLPKNAPSGLDLRSIINSDKQFNEISQELKRIVETSFAQAEKYLERFMPLGRIFEYSLKWDFDNYQKRVRAVNVLRNDLRRMSQWMSDVMRINISSVTGILTLDARPLKQLLAPIPAKCSEQIKSHLHALFEEISSNTTREFKELTSKMANLPHNLSDYTEFVVLLSTMGDHHSRLQTEVNALDEMKVLAEEQGIKLSLEEIMALSQTHDSQTEFQQTLGKSQEYKEAQHNRMVGALHKEAAKLESDTVQTFTDLGSGILVDETGDPQAALQRLDVVSNIVNGYKERQETLESYRLIIKLDEIPYPNVQRCVSRFEHRHGVWSLLQNFLTESAKWRGTTLTELDAENVELTVQSATREVGLMEKTDPEDKVVKHLRELIDEFKPFVPILTALCIEAMKPRHWKKLFSLMGKQWSQGMTLSQFLSLNVLQYKNQIFDISATANGEYALESQLKKIVTIWDTMAFEIKNHKSGSTYILGPIDEITEQLEDHQALLQTMLASRFVVGIRTEIEGWDKKLQSLQELMDEWVKCQRGWMYLSAIFSQPDIVRQLPAEAEKFDEIDKSWKDVMNQAHANPKCTDCLEIPSIIEIMQKNNKMLDEVQKRLEDYLETKRVKFPRFYFLSNDELLQILAQTADARAVQPFMSKCFDSINSLMFISEQALKEAAEGKESESISPSPSSTPVPGQSQSPQGERNRPDFVTTMVSIENEMVELTDPVSTRMPVETWLLNFEAVMRTTVKDQIRLALQGFHEMERTEWVFRFPAQAILAVDQIMWTAGAMEALDQIATGANPNAMEEFLEKNKKDLSDSVNLVRGNLEPLQRATVNTLIVVDVHARDIVAEMVKQKTSSPEEFDWIKNLRYEWDTEQNECIVKQTSTSFIYGYEYLGNSPRLVITPLTDRCYITLTLSLHLHLGGNPAGPAGTGKTETTKDLAKALARQCVVFNCSDQLDVGTMGRFFSGLVQAGAWACFDEFNRIDIEVLSVIAQQLLTILDAVRSRVSFFEFEGNNIKLNPNCGFFITMNPGYAGRTELPDNLKALFRPVAMMIPDYALIAEIMLFSEGFQTAKDLASKMTQLYKLSSEQLSQQDHYDFGMRAVKSVLVMAGSLKRKYDTLSEDIVLIRALRDTNTPKFLSEDVPLFMNIIKDLFPGVTIPPIEHASLQQSLKNSLVVQGLQPAPQFMLKSIQLYETMEVRHGVMLVGETGVGKTTCLRALCNAMSDLYDMAQNGQIPVGFGLIKTTTLNPKAVTMGELYGQFNEVTREWFDGLVPYYVKEMIERSKSSIAEQAQALAATGQPQPPIPREILIFDGPVDAIWIESMNSVLDDNKILCLSNGDRIKLTNNMTMLFEVADLRVASPATVSRCGMIYLERQQMGWRQMAESWAQQFTRAFPHLEQFTQSAITFLIEPTLKFLRKSEFTAGSSSTAASASGTGGPSLSEFIPNTSATLVSSLLNLFTSLAEMYANAHPSKQAPVGSQANLASGSAGGGGRKRKKVSKQSQSGSATPSGAAQNAQHDLRDSIQGQNQDASGSGAGQPQEQLVVGKPPPTHMLYPPAPGSTLFDKKFYDDQYPFNMACKQFVFCLIWTFGSSLDDQSKPKFNDFLLGLITLNFGGSDSDEEDEGRSYDGLAYESGDYSEAPGSASSASTERRSKSRQKQRAAAEFMTSEQFMAILVGITFPRGVGVFDVAVNDSTGTWEKWSQRVPQFVYNPNQPYEEIVVQTTDTVATTTLLDLLVKAKMNVLVTGGTGTGKTIVVNDFLHLPDIQERSLSFQVNFSAQTKAKGTQEVLEGRLTHRRSNLIGPPVGKQGIVFVDDLNTPTPEVYFAQPPIELLRQCIDQNGMYDRKKLTFIHLADTMFIAACGPPGGGRNEMTQRLTRRFHTIGMPHVGKIAMTSIFSAITSGFLSNQKPALSQIVQQLALPLVEATVALYSKVSSTFLPTPSRSHYTFNLRDASSLVSGVLHASPVCFASSESLVRLWVHEGCRVFRDRLIDNTDRTAFDEVMNEVVLNHFTEPEQPLEECVSVSNPSSIVFTDFPERPGQPRIYHETELNTKLSGILNDHLEDYNLSNLRRMNLVLFDDAVRHLARISRIIRMPRGNALVVGLGGSGRQSLIRLATHIAGCKFETVEVSKNYGQAEFREDLKRSLRISGEKAQQCVLYLSDNQLVKESFLEDINNLLNVGDIPNIWAPDEIDQIVDNLRQSAKEAGKGQGRDDVMQHFTSLIRSNLHVVLCMSPSSREFRSRLRQFPSLVNCCTMDWYDPWPAHALLQVARRRTVNWTVDSKYTEAMAQACVYIHVSVEKASDRYLRELKRHNYTTPTSYLELLESYEGILREMDQSIAQRHSKLSNGLKTLVSTNEEVAEMQQKLTAIQPQLEQSQKDTVALMGELTEQQKEVEAKKTVVEAEEAVVSQSAAEAEALAQDAQNDLDRALPKYRAAIKAVESLDKADITEVKSFVRPPDLVMFVLQAVCLLFHQPQTWEAAKKMMNAEFLSKLSDYDKDGLDDKLKAQLKKTYISSPKFQPEVVGSVSKAAKSLCAWVCALYDYSEVAREVEPKKVKVKESKEKLAIMQQKLAEKKAELQEVEDKMAMLKNRYDASVRKKATIEEEIEATKLKLNRAEKLVGGLSNEYKRWTETVAELEASRATLFGDALIATGYVTYLGPFTSEYRKSLTKQWIAHIAKLGIPVQEEKEFSLSDALGNPIQIRSWRLAGLPSDSLSIANAIIATRSRRWCLMIDPQNQANRWIKNIWKEKKIKIVKPHDATLMRTMENSVRVGVPVLLENAGETFDPALTPILGKNITRVGTRITIRIGDQDVDYSEDFSLHVTTTLPNPHYSPEISIAMTIINFTVTPSGLAEQLLGETVRIERPDLESQRDTLILQAAKDADDMNKVEDNILTLLSSVSGSILDSEDVIEALDKSRDISAEIKVRAQKTSETTELINRARDEYRAVSQRGSLIYFVVASMANADPMYQFSLSFFTNLFSRCIKDAQSQKPVLPEGQQPTSAMTQKHVALLVDVITKTVFANVCRGLFERDKQIFSFLIASEICRERGVISMSEWRLFLLGKAAIVSTQPSSTAGNTKRKHKHSDGDNSDDENDSATGSEDEGEYNNFDSDMHFSEFRLERPSYLKESQWELILALEKIKVMKPKLVFNQTERSQTSSSASPSPAIEMEETKPFEGISYSLSDSARAEWEQWIAEEKPEEARMPEPWCSCLNIFQRLLIVRCLREERVIFGTQMIVEEYLGSFFSDPPPFDMKSVFDASSPSTPIVFILSPGTDPASMLRQFAMDSGCVERLVLKSLGQGQGPSTEALIRKGTAEGLWVCLQNCHLCTSWMPSMEAIVEKFSTPDAELHPDFRLFLTSMPSKAFPVPVLQTSIKITNEPPRGLRVNLLRSLSSFEEHFDSHWRKEEWHRLLFGLGFFHAVIQERRKFGPLGWNILYDWTMADLDVSRELLYEYLGSGGEADSDANEMGNEEDEEDNEFVDEDEEAVSGEETNRSGDGDESHRQHRRSRGRKGKNLRQSTAASLVPFKALEYIVGEISYGGRVTDVWDMRTLQAIFKLFFCKSFLNEEVNITPDGMYSAPPLDITFAEMEHFVKQLPLSDKPEVFGLHPNANITYQQRETGFLLSTIIKLQPNVSAPETTQEEDEEEEEDEDLEEEEEEESEEKEENETNGEKEKDNEEKDASGTEEKKEEKEGEEKSDEKNESEEKKDDQNGEAEEEKKESGETEEEKKEETEKQGSVKSAKVHKEKAKKKSKAKHPSVPSSDDIVTGMCKRYASQIPKSLDYSHAHPSVIVRMAPATPGSGTNTPSYMRRSGSTSGYNTPSGAVSRRESFANFGGLSQTPSGFGRKEFREAFGGDDTSSEVILGEIDRGERLTKDLDTQGEITANPLNIVLQQEVERFNKLLRTIHASLRDLQAAVSGLVVMSASLEGMYSAFLIGQVPTLWSDAAYPSLKPLASWVVDLCERVAFVNSWIENGAPTSFLLPGFFFPQGFLTGVLQMHSRQTKIPIDTLVFRCHVADTVLTKREAREAEEQNSSSNTSSSSFLSRSKQHFSRLALDSAGGASSSTSSRMNEDNHPATPAPKGVFIHGLFLEGARWDLQSHNLVESQRGVLFDMMPTLWLEPVVRGTPPVTETEESEAMTEQEAIDNMHPATGSGRQSLASFEARDMDGEQIGEVPMRKDQELSEEMSESNDPTAKNAPVKKGIYECPVYKTQARYGVLSTTGHSTNFIFALDLPTIEPPEKWIRSGVAMLCTLSE